MCRRILFICLIFTSAMCNFADQAGIEDEIRANFTKLMKSAEEQMNFLKLLSRLIERIDERLNESKSKNDKVGEMTSRCTLLCESKVKTLVNEFDKNLENLDFCVKKKDANSSAQCDKNTFNPCVPDPCLNGGNCEVTSSGNDYACTDCTYPMGGKRCDDLSCDSNAKCFRDGGDTVYLVHETRSYWDESRQWCVDRGMELAMPKDNETIAYIVHRLRTLYGADTRAAFWFGLKFDSSDRKWTWVDGSTLEDGAEKTAEPEDYGLPEDYSLCGGWDSRGQKASWSVGGCDVSIRYALCEKHLLRPN